MANLKGGVWTNVEDEILKVAVMKYGVNQWARISSLLVRKSAKQCKARWTEWLDPRIKKTLWSKEEDEKLVHLAKVFPSQWGTVGEIVGRTPQMCLERYEKLLDATQEDEDEENGESNVSSTSKLAENRSLLPGEMDTNPESRPARPDPVDMDEDEKEMLAEARARLANTQGKKARRKARQKLLDEAKRLTNLQKRKELIAAGLPTLPLSKKKNKGMDYNIEIPFERQPAPGFHVVEDELETEAQNKPILQEKIKEKQQKSPTKQFKDLEERRADLEKDKKRKEKGLLPLSLERKMRQEKAAMKVPLTLPSPQITDADLKQLTKYGFTREAGARLDMNGTPSISHMTPDTPNISSKDSVSGRPAYSTVKSTMSKFGKTPIRDELGINPTSFEYEKPESEHKSALADAFSKLPQPKNDFDLLYSKNDHILEKDNTDKCTDDVNIK